jgi:hypothetical protein
MKGEKVNIIFLVLPLILLIFSCEENTPGRKLRLVNMTPIECADQKDLILDYRFQLEKDTVTYVIIDNQLTLTVGFNGNCCSTFLASSTFVRDTIEVEILETIPGICNCICYFTTDLVYEGLDKNYHYTVVLPNDKIFRGEIEFE